MKKLFIILLLLISVAGCSNNPKEIIKPGTITQISTKKIIQSPKLTLSVKEGTLTNTGIKMHLKNNFDSPLHYNSEFFIEKENNNSWYEVKRLKEEMMIVASDPTLKKGETTIIGAAWEPWYGKLPQGKYRIIFEFNYENEEPFFTALEFILN